jgi:hypothetical protein
MMNYAVVDEKNIVVNVIAWDGVTSYNPGTGLTLVRSDTAAIGHIYLDGAFIKPAQGGE